MPDRRAGDWRNGVDVDAEMVAWRGSTRTAQRIFAFGLAVAVVFLIAFALVGNRDGVGYMATAVFFMAAIAGTLTLLGRRAV